MAAHTTLIRGYLASLAFAAAVLSPVSASARCAGAVAFGTLHDAYLATLVGDGEMQKLAAKTVLFTAGGSEAERFAKGLKRSGVEVDLERLETVLQDAVTLARQTLEQQRTADENTFHHSQHVTWMAKLFQATGCARSAETASAVPAYATPSTPARVETPRSRTTQAVLQFWPLGLFLAVVAIAVAGHKFSKSLIVRRRQLERMPRFSISLPLAITYTDSEGDMQQAKVEALDISQGGLKLRWEDAPAPGILLTLELLGAQRLATVTWSNAYFAGILFETPLNKADLRSLKEGGT